LSRTACCENIITMAWSLTAATIVASQLQAGEQGLLVAAVDASSKTVTVLGSVPVAAGGFQDAAGGSAIREILG
jgi:hypothetical protein